MLCAGSVQVAFSLAMDPSRPLEHNHTWLRLMSPLAVCPGEEILLRVCLEERVPTSISNLVSPEKSVATM